MVFVNMLKYNETNKRFEILKYEIKFTLDGVDKLLYSSELDNYIAYSKANPGVSNFSYVEVNLNTEQEQRLNFLNSSTFSQNECITYITDFSLFVQYAYIRPECELEFLKNLKEEYKDKAVKILVEKASSIFKEIRKDKENAGVAYANKIVDTDRDSQQSITSSVVMLQNKLVETINYKCQNNEYLFNLTLDDMLTLSSIVSSYVQTCYTAEAMCSNYLSSLSPTEIIEFIQEDKVKARELYEKQFKTVYEESNKKMQDNLKIAKG